MPPRILLVTGLLLLLTFVVRTNAISHRVTPKQQEAAINALREHLQEQHHRKLRLSGASSRGKLWGFRNPSPRTYTVESDIFNVSIKMFSQDFVEPYTDTSELEEDLTEVFKLFANAVISGNAGNPLARTPGIPEVEFDSAPPDASGQTDFATNNQEEGVDEADTVKSDGTYVFAAYGDTIVVWEALTGVLVTNVTMPRVVFEIPSYPQTTAAQARRSEPQYYFQRPSIEGLLLSNNRLAAIVNGYGGPIVQELNYTPALYNTLSTRVIIYDTSSLGTTGELTKLHEKDMDGYYRDARSIGDNVHLVTTSQIDVYGTIMWPLSRWNDQFIDLSEEDYQEAARIYAQDEIIPGLVTQLISDLKDEELVLPTLARVGLWQESLSEHPEVENFMYMAQPIVDTYTQVASFSLQDDGEELTVNLSGSFMPSSWGYTYTTPDYLIFAAQGWDWTPNLNGNVQTTYLMGFALDGTTSTPSAVASMPGFLLNQYSLDIQDGYLRVATSIRSFWTWIEVVEDTPAIDGDPGDELPSVTRILPIVQSETFNQVIIFQIPEASGEAGTFEEVGRLDDLGKPGELFTTVRFFEDLAYVVTFERTDPFYALNLSTPTEPGILGELEITGFSSYLHPMNDNKTLLVAVGQEADDMGRVLGAQITIFDATKPASPSVVDRYTIEQDSDTWSGTNAEWDYKAFRYLRLGDDYGLAILPMLVTSWRDRSQNFDGFFVLDVGAQSGIDLRFNITHAQAQDFFGCYYSAQLPQRSLVFDGNVTTLKGHTVLSTDLNTGERTWELPMMTPDNPADCVYWF